MAERDQIKSDQLKIDPVQLLVMANRIDGITREMTNTLVRTARSATLVARDFSCSIADADHELFAAPEGIPVHVFGTGLLCESMADLHPDFREGDAFLHNDPYLGNSHPADHTVMVPVFYQGEHIFTCCVKAHQADVGNAIPTTYTPKALDVYQEGALIFPCVKVQEDYQDVGDIIRMCQKRIRVPQVWYGDYLGMLAAARVGEERVKNFCDKFGLDTVKLFVQEWKDYCERVADSAIRQLPKGHVHAQTALDPFPNVPDGIPLQAEVDIDPDAGQITIDMRDNQDCTPTGLNLSQSTATNAAISGVLMVLNSDRDAKAPVVLNNAGSFRRFHVKLRENCVVGIPRHPASCSMATNTVADRAMSMIYSAFAQLGDGFGLAEPCFGSGPFQGVVSGYNHRRQEPYVLQLFSGTAGGPGGPQSDGWLTLFIPAGNGLLYMDEAEVIEQKYPFMIWDNRVRPDSEGPGRNRGAPGNICIYGTLDEDMEVHYSLDGSVNPPQGVLGGGPALGPSAELQDPDGTWTHLPDIVGEQVVPPRHAIVSLSAGGGGYGDPHTRDPHAILIDVVEGYISAARAKDAYAVALSGDPARVETLTVDAPATAALRG